MCPEPMAVLCCKQQLNDLVQFCCDPFEFCILGIDPTFNLVSPSCIQTFTCGEYCWAFPSNGWAMLVHHRKEFQSYNYFLSTLVGLNQQAAAVKAVGADDGEKTLVDAVLQNFPEAVHMSVALDICGKM